MRILLSFLALGFLVWFGMGLADFLGDMRGPAAMAPAEYLASAPSSGRVILKSARLDYPELVWFENKRGEIREVYIPFSTGNASSSKSANLWLHTKDAADLLLARKMKAGSSGEVVPLILAASLERGGPKDREVRPEDGPLRKEDFPAGSKFLAAAGGEKTGFPVVALGLLVAAGFFLVANFPGPRAEIRLENGDTFTVVGLAQQDLGQLPDLIAKGGRLVMYQWCLSVLILTFKRPSELYFLRPGENAVARGLHCSFVTLFLGWWGFPWGPVYTLQSFWVNMTGGKDLSDVFRPVASSEPPPAVPGGG